MMNTIKLSIIALLLGTQLQAHDVHTTNVVSTDQALQPAFSADPADRSFFKTYVGDFVTQHLTFAGNHISADDIFNWLDENNYLRFFPKGKKGNENGKLLLYVIGNTEISVLNHIEKYLEDNNLKDIISSERDLCAAIFYFKQINNATLNDFTKYIADNLDGYKNSSEKDNNLRTFFKNFLDEYMKDSEKSAQLSQFLQTFQGGKFYDLPYTLSKIIDINKIFKNYKTA